MRRAENSPELLDESRHDARELEQSLVHVAQVNRFLGGRRALLRHLAPFLAKSGTTRILDVGTGSADLPRAIVAWARTRQAEIAVVASDLHPQMCDIARRSCANYPEITISEADALALPFADGSFDIVTVCLTLHHFDGAEQLRLLREAGRVARQAVIVSELKRGVVNFAGAKLLAWTWWRGNRITRHDGPLSVRRAFTRNELQSLAEEAGLRARIYGHYFQRLVLVAQP